ncbi:MAG: hypothetical protein ACREE6_00745 [Limisphaerales bacterium]
MQFFTLDMDFCFLIALSNILPNLWAVQHLTVTVGVSRKKVSSYMVTSIEGELQPIRKYTATAPATHSDDDIRACVLARAINDLSGCSEEFNCWHCKIVSSSSTFLADINEAVKGQGASWQRIASQRFNAVCDDWNTLVISCVNAKTVRAKFFC